MIRRYALIGSPASRIAAYLPDNYQVLGVIDGQTVIGGRDRAGWTLDAYVIPRLASGLYFATEIDLSHPVMSQPPVLNRAERLTVHRKSERAREQNNVADGISQVPRVPG